MAITPNRTFLGAAAVLLLTSGTFADAVANDVSSSCAAGREISPGITLGDTTYGVVFAAWLTNDSDCRWLPVWLGNGGSLVATVQRQGDAGFGEEVELTGGFFKLKLDDSTEAKACVEGGTVRWPNGPNNAVAGEDCGNGVAVVSADLSWGCTGVVSGGFDGCLDDQAWLGPQTRRTLRLPPKIWGELWAGEP